MSDKIKTIVKIWEESIWLNPYEVKQILDYKKILKFYLIKLDTIYHDFAWGIGDVGEWNEIKYLAVPQEALEWSVRELKLWFKEQPIKGREKTKETNDIFCEVDYKKQLRLLESPKGIEKRIKKLKYELEAIKHREDKLVKLNIRLQKLALEKEDYEYLELLESKGDKMMKIA